MVKFRNFLLGGLAALSLSGCSTYEQVERVENKTDVIIQTTDRVERKIDKLDLKNTFPIDIDVNNDGLIDLLYASYDERTGLKVDLALDFKTFDRSRFTIYSSPRVFRDPQIEPVDLNKDGRMDFKILSLDYYGNKQIHHLIQFNDFRFYCLKVN